MKNNNNTRQSGEKQPQKAANKMAHKVAGKIAKLGAGGEKAERG